MPPASSLVVGIDLGTTHTVVAWADPERGTLPQAFPIPQLVSGAEVATRALLPSFLYARLEGETSADLWGDAPWTVGDYARRRGQEVPGRLVASAKSWLCHSAVDRTAAILPWGTDVVGLPRLSPIDASTRILNHVRRAWNAEFPANPLEAQQLVLTVPASFDQAARELTLRAASAAGLNVRLLEEPQAAFYDWLTRTGRTGLETLLGSAAEVLVLVCDVGGGTTDLTLIRAARGRGDAIEVDRVAVGRHLLLGGDNMDLALAHGCEARLVEPPARLEPQRFAQLILACRAAKERLLATEAPDSVSVTVLGSGSALIGGALTTRLEQSEVERVVLEGFFPHAARDAPAQRKRTGIVAFGLPYEQDPAITRHLASFFARHAPDARGPRGLLLNGGVFHAPRLAERILDTVRAWEGPPLELLSNPDPDLAVARGAVAYGLALAGHGQRIGGGAAHGYYVGIESEGTTRRALCLVPRGSKEGEHHVAAGRTLALRVGRPVRFELFSSDSGPVHAPGQIAVLDDEHFEVLPPIATTFTATEAEALTATPAEIRVMLEGELSAIGTLDLACVEVGVAAPRHFRLAFELRGAEPAVGSRVSERPRDSTRPFGRRFDDACEAIQRVFGKGRSDVKPRETRDLVRELERLLGERRSWSADLNRQLFDVIGPKHRARRRSADHERVYWMLSGYCLRPGYGHALDPQRIAILSPLFGEGLTFGEETRSWQQFFIAWRRIAGGLKEDTQCAIRDTLDPFLASRDQNLKRPKGFKPEPVFELVEFASCLERLPTERRAALGRWLLERTWTDRDPRLWAAIGRIGARVPAYASVHHVIGSRVVEGFIDHLLREKWQEVPTAARTAVQLARVTDDRARDVSEPVRKEIARHLERAGAPAAFTRAVLEHVPIEEAERAEFFGEELPVGLRLVE